MSIEFLCQVCGRELKADERAIGRKVRCPDCATLLVIPDPEAFEDDEAGNEPVPQERQAAYSPDAADEPTQREQDIGATAPMELDEVQSLPAPPSAPVQPPQPRKKQRAEKQRPRPEEVETRRESSVPL